MGKWTGAVLLLALLCLALRAEAEFYRYTDENGVLRFTDNLQEVPADQRPGLKKYKEADDDLTPAQRAAKRQREAEAARQTKIKQRQQEKLDDVGEIRIDSPEDFERIKADLEDDHESLMRRKAALEAERDTLTTAEEVHAYRKKIDRLNEEIQRFEERRKKFVQKADQFNTRKN
jgi:MoaA/NifB/PqqE/SkfB family radical SAM enzyme